MSHIAKEETKGKVGGQRYHWKKHAELDNIHNALSLLSTLMQPAKPAVFQLF